MKMNLLGLAGGRLTGAAGDDNLCQEMKPLIICDPIKIHAERKISNYSNVMFPLIYIIF